MTPLDPYLDDFGRRLRDTRVPERRVPLVTRGVIVALVAAAVLAVVLISGNDAARPADAVAAARAAVAPASGDIVHLRYTTRNSARGGVRLSRRVRRQTRTEQWTTGDPARWRVRVAELHRDARRAPLVSDTSFADGTQTAYDAERNRLFVARGLSPRGLAARIPGVFGTDPEEAVLSLLGSGRARDAGVVRSDGREVRRITASRRRGRIVERLVYDVDPATSAPVAGRLTIEIPRRPSRRSAPPYELVKTFTIEAYDRLPLTEENERLLVVRAPRDARVHTTP